MRDSPSSCQLRPRAVPVRVNPFLRAAAASALLGLGLAFGISTAASAAPTEEGRNLAATCASCHNTSGRAIGDSVPLAGVPAENIVNAMRAFREGRRAATIMHQLAKGYTDEQIRLMADYFAAQK